MKRDGSSCVRRAWRVALALALGCGLGGVANADVLVDLFHGENSRLYLPPPGTALLPNYANLTPGGTGAARYDGVQRLLAFAADDANIATPVSGTVLPNRWSSFSVPIGANMLCEYPYGPGTTDACKNTTMGAVMYAALLVPNAGTYKIGGGSNCNDGAIFDTSAAAGTEYRQLGYGTRVETFCYADDGVNNGTFTTSAPNTLINVRVAWNNWGNEALLVVNWTPPGSTTAVAIPAGNLYDPSALSTYLAATDDALGSFAAGQSGASTVSVFSNDRVNVATTAVATGAGANLSSYRAVDAPAGVTLNPDGTISVPATLDGGSYSFTYEICRSSLQPAACVTAKASFTVTGSLVPASVPVLGPLGGWALFSLLAGAGGLALRRRS